MMPKTGPVSPDNQLAAQKPNYNHKGFTNNSQLAKQSMNAAAANGIRERRNHSIAGYASGLALGTVANNNLKNNDPANNLTSPISIVASNSIKNNRLLFKNESPNDINFQSPQ